MIFGKFGLENIPNLFVPIHQNNLVKTTLKFFIKSRHRKLCLNRAGDPTQWAEVHVQFAGITSDGGIDNVFPDTITVNHLENFVVRNKRKQIKDRWSDAYVFLSAAQYKPVDAIMQFFEVAPTDHHWDFVPVGNLLHFDNAVTITERRKSCDFGPLLPRVCQQTLWANSAHGCEQVAGIVRQWGSGQKPTARIRLNE